MDNDTLKLLGAGGGFTILLGAFVWLLRTVGLTVGKAIVDALKENTVAINEHTATPLRAQRVNSAPVIVTRSTRFAGVLPARRTQSPLRSPATDGWMIATF